MTQRGSGLFLRMMVRMYLFTFHRSRGIQRYRQFRGTAVGDAMGPPDGSGLLSVSSIISPVGSRNKKIEKNVFGQKVDLRKSGSPLRRRKCRKRSLHLPIIELHQLAIRLEQSTRKSSSRKYQYSTTRY